MDLMAAITEERLRLADWLESLDDGQWATPSSCAGWTVLEVAAHLLAGPVLGLRRSTPFLIRARGNFAVLNDLAARHLAETLGADGVVAALRDNAEHRFRPPGFSHAAPLTDLTIHGQDMSRPLGVDLGVPVERWRIPLDTASARQYGFFNARKHLDGLRFETSDLDWSTGSGPVVTGSARDLAHAMWGRADAAAHVTGDGADELRRRLTAAS